MTVVDVLLLVARLGAGAFAGSCLYIAIAQQPARMSLPLTAALEEFRATIPRAERMQPPLTVLTLVVAIVIMVLRFDILVAVAAVLMAFVLVETVVGVLPINRRLTTGATADHPANGRHDLRRWGLLHGVRTVAATGAAVLLLL